MRKVINIIILVVLFFIPQIASAQIVTNPDQQQIDVDSLRRDFDKRPYFGLYKDNYFIFGTALGSERPSRTNSNVKFQLSISQRLTKTVLPYGTYLYLFYSQKCFWNVLENSMPMTDLNFNPGIGLAKPLFVKNKYIGKVSLIVEHESNGRDEEESRSWNKVSLATDIMIDRNFVLSGKVWIPIIDGVNNKDILNYCGLYQVCSQYKSNNERVTASVILTKRKGWNLNYNTVVEFCYRFSRRENQYFFIQYYNGYGEGLLEYNKFHSEIRAGICIKPKLYSEY
jgi:phospholipase A1